MFAALLIGSSSSGWPLRRLYLEVSLLPVSLVITNLPTVNKMEMLQLVLCDLLKLERYLALSAQKLAKKDEFSGTAEVWTQNCLIN